jgi:hypothetical protein
MTQLTPEQQSAARQWIADGIKLSDFQKKLETDFGIKLTYMEVRFLVDDLKVIPKDPEPPKAPVPPPAPAKPAAPNLPPEAALDPDEVVPADDAAPAGGGVSVTVDAVVRPGALVSGRVKFSDGKGAAWLVDQMGRPGLIADEKGYRPAQQDMMEFQVALERELMKLGF